MTPFATPERSKNRRFLGVVISHGVWLYYRLQELQSAGHAPLFLVSRRPSRALPPQTADVGGDDVPRSKKELLREPGCTNGDGASYREDTEDRRGGPSRLLRVSASTT